MRHAVEKEQVKVLGMADNIFCEVAMKSSWKNTFEFVMQH